MIELPDGGRLYAEELCGFYAGYVYGIAHAVWLTVGGGDD